jgi:hypothetical protein
MRRFVPILLCLVTACSASDRGVPPAQRDSAGALAARGPALDPEARAACDAATRRWRGAVGRITLRAADTLLSRDGVILNESEANDGAPAGAVDGRWPACAVAADAPAGVDSAGRAALAWQTGEWVMLPRLNADGVDGGLQLYQRGLVRCQVAQEWDGGDVSDPTYVPAPFYRTRALCWNHGRPVTPSDTANAG